MKIKYLILFLLLIAATLATLGQRVETYADSSRQLSVTQIKAIYAQGRFTPLVKNRLLQNYTTANHWLHLRLPPGSRRLQYLEIENPRLNQVVFYQMVGDSLIDEVVTGDSLPFGSRRFAHYQWVFQVLPDATQPTDVFVKVAKYGEVLSTGVRLWEPAAFENFGRSRYLLWGILAGMTGLILLLNGMVWLATADVLYGWFMAIVVVSAFHLGVASGLFFQYLWPNTPMINEWYPQTLSAWLIVLFQVHFMQKFINQTAQNSRVFRFVNAFKYGIIAATVLTISLLMLRAVPAFYFQVLLILTLLFSLMVVPLAILSLRERLRQREPIILFYMGITTVQFLTLGLFFVNMALSRAGRPLFAFPNEGLVLVNYLVDLILLAPGVLYFGFKRYRQQNEQLLTTLHQQEQAQSERVIEALEMERSRMAEDLYDDVGAMLSTAIGYVSSVQRKPEVREKFPLLTEARRLLDRAVENLRTVSHNLMPKNFAELGLAQSLAETIDKVQAATDIRFQYLVVGNERRLDTGTEVQIFRIAAELINDIMKNSQASEATLQLVFHENHLLLIAEDNGPEPPEYTNLQSKVAFLNGKIDTDISPDGVTVVVEIPH